MMPSTSCRRISDTTVSKSQMSPPHEGVVGPLLDIAQVLQVAGIGQLVEVDDAAVGYFVTKSRTTCEPMNPAPPVISIDFIALAVVAVL